MWILLLSLISLQMITCQLKPACLKRVGSNATQEPCTRGPKPGAAKLSLWAPITSRPLDTLETFIILETESLESTPALETTMTSISNDEWIQTSAFKDTTLSPESTLVMESNLDILPSFTVSVPLTSFQDESIPTETSNSLLPSETSYTDLPTETTQEETLVPTIAKEGEHCLGFIFPPSICADGLKCVRIPGLPLDVGGTCQKA